MQDGDNRTVPEQTTAGWTRRSALRRIGLGGVGAGIIAGVAHSAVGAQSSLSTAATEAAARRAIAAINQTLASGDPAPLDAAFAANYVNHTPRFSLTAGQPTSPDLAGLKASLQELRTLAPDAAILIRDIVASQDTASVLGTLVATIDLNAIAIPGLTNPRIRVDGVIYAHFADGRVTESWEYDDAAETLGAAIRATPTPIPVPPTAVPPTQVPPTAVALPEGMTSEARDVSNFHAVSLEGIGTLIIQQGQTESLTVEAEARIIDRIETVVENGTLMIRPTRSIKTRRDIIYHLSVIQLDGIAVAGAGRVQSAALSANQLQLATGGTAGLYIDSLTGQTLGVGIGGSSQVVLAGTVDTQTVEIAATGSYDGSKLASRVATVTVQGTGQATVNVSETLNATAGGTGRIAYIGNPQVSQNVSGVGSVTQIG